MKTQAEAQRCADCAKDQMDQPELWKCRVWENLGWHWSIEANNVTVHPGSDGTYFALIAGDANECGHGYAGWAQDKHNDNHPQQAVNRALVAASKYVDGLSRALETARVAGRS